ncbi:MAG: PAS domain S-box protein, partial [Verrucomicrobia bacterium]|nr:PAS domain S-box protein [Verrucomicrobiota bacterium]
VSDALIALAYYTIPLTLVYFVRRRTDLAFHGMFLCFALFIVACGTTHALEVWSIWHPVYWLAGVVKAVTAALSVATAVALLRLVPKALALPGLQNLRDANRGLQAAQDVLRGSHEQLERRVDDCTASLAAANAALQSGIEERKLTEERSSELEGQFWTVIAKSPIAALICDETGAIRFMNEGWTECCGYTLEELPTLADWRRRACDAHGDAVARVWMEESFASSEPVHHEECTIRAKDGGQRLWDVYTTVLGKDRVGTRLRLIQAVDLTERQAAEEGCAWLAAIVEGSADAIIGKTLDGIVTSWNHGAQCLFGYTAEEMVGQSLGRLVPPDRPDEEAQILAGLRRGERVEHCETVRRCKDGRLVEVSLSISPVRDRRGRLIGASKIARDIIRQKRAEQALRESQARFAGVIDSAMDAIISIDEAQRVVLFNAAAERMFHYAASEVLGQPMERLIPERMRAAHSAHVRTFAQTGVTSRAMGHLGELSAVRADGQEFPIEASISQVAVGGAMLFTVILRDVTERKAADAALRQSEIRFRTLAESLPQSIWTCQPDGPCDYLSPQWFQYTGVPTEDQLGYRWAGQLHPDDRQRTLATWAAVVRTGSDFNIEFRLRRADGVYRWFQARAVATRDSAGQITKWVGFNADVEDLKQAEERLRSLNAQLAAANKELEAFTYSVSHDLRAPLRHMMGFAKLLQGKEGPGLSPTVQRYLRVISAEAARMGKLIDDLLAFSRAGRTELRREQVNLGALVTEVIDSLTADTQGRSIRWSIGPLPIVNADPTLLRGVLTNLIDNALKFTRHRPEAQIEIGCRQAETETIFFVRDNGTGFDMKYVDKLFGVFHRLHSQEDFEGSGIGLANVRRTVQRHGGRTWAEGAIDTGATFYFSLPNDIEINTHDAT